MGVNRGNAFLVVSEGHQDYEMSVASVRAILLSFAGPTMWIRQNLQIRKSSATA